MKAKSISKRVLSVILCTVMLFSCWVFSAPTAVAQNAGNYDVKVTIKTVNANNCKAAYQGLEKNKKDTAGVSIEYISNNGMGTTSEYKWDIGNGSTGLSYINNAGAHTLTATVSGFPSKIGGYVCDDLFMGIGNPSGFQIQKLEVKGTSQTSYTTLWEGTMQFKSRTNGYGGWLRYDGYTKGWDHGMKNADEGNQGDDENYITASDKKSWTAKFPYRSSGGAVSASNITLDGTNSKTSAFTVGDAKDQYSVNYATSNLDSTAMSTPSYNSSYITYSGDSGNPARTITATKNAHIWNDGVNSQNVSVTAYWKTRNTTNTMANTTTSKTISITDEKYTYTWNWKETNTSNLDSPSDKSTTLSPYYGDTPSIPSTATDKPAYYTSAKHWSGGSYTTPARASAAKSYTMTYSVNGVDHSFTYSEISGNHTYHKGTCSCGYALSTTFKHTYGAPTITFAANGKTATASRTCTTTGCNHTQTITATVTPAVKTPATCSAVGTTTYTATATFTKVNEETVLTVTDTKDVDDIPIVSTAHNWTNTKTYPRTPAKCGEDATYWKECSHNTNHKAETLDTTQYWTDEHTAKAHDYGDPTKLTVDETYREENYAAASYHKQICGRDTLCNDGADCNGEYPVKYTEHTMSPWAYTLPTDDGSRVIGIVLEQLADFDGESKCYSYCIYCGYTKTQPHHDWQVVEDETVTYDATCTTAGQTTSACLDCGKTKIETIPALGHDPELKRQSTPDDRTAGKCYYQCTRCDKYFAAFDNGTDYYPDDTAKDTLQEALAVEGSADIPAPTFNSYDDPDIGYNYDLRGASLKLTKETEAGVNTIQKMRFAGSVAVPANMDNEIKYANYDHYIKGELDQITDDNCILDFGFVYTQMQYIAEEPAGDYDSYEPDLSKIVIGGDNMAKMSVPSKNSASGTLDISGDTSTWAGVSPHQDSGSTFLTFNLLINVKEKNWKRIYAARTYITYKYHGEIYTVYDGTTDDYGSARAVWYVAKATLEEYGKETEPSIVKMCQFLRENITEKDNIEPLIQSDGNGSDWWRYRNDGLDPSEYDF